MEAANAPAAAANEEEEADELTAGEEATMRRLETAARKGRLNFQPKVEVKVSWKPKFRLVNPAARPRMRLCWCVCPSVWPCKHAPLA